MDVKKEITELKNNPDKQIEFIEKMYGEHLYPHQKLLLKLMIVNKNKGVYFSYPFRNGRVTMKKFLEKWKELFL